MKVEIPCDRYLGQARTPLIMCGNTVTKGDSQPLIERVVLFVRVLAKESMSIAFFKLGQISVGGSVARQPEAALLKRILLAAPNACFQVEAFVEEESQFVGREGEGVDQEDVKALKYDDTLLAASLKGGALGHHHRGLVDGRVEGVSVESLGARVARNRPSPVGVGLLLANSTTFYGDVVKRVHVDLRDSKVVLLEIQACGLTGGADADAFYAPDQHKLNTLR